MQNLKVADLIPHPKNEYYFDDIKGDGWDDFLKSIRTSGVTNAITVDQRNYIISGHQRVRACKLLGIEEIPAYIVSYTEEELNAEYPKDEKDLIESNLKQRVAGNANAVKLGRCFAFLEGFYEIKNGRPAKEKTSNNVGNKTQEDLIRELGLNKETYRQAKKLAQLPEEIQQAVEDGQISASTAVRTIAKLPREQQKEIADHLYGSEKRYTDAEVRQLLKEHQSMENQELSSENSKLRQENLSLKNRPPEVREVVKDKSLEQENADLRKKLAEANNTANRRYEEKKDAERRLAEAEERLQREKDETPGDRLARNRIEDVEYFTASTYTFVKRFGGFVWSKEELESVPDDKVARFKTALFSLDAMVKQMIENTGGYQTV